MSSSYVPPRGLDGRIVLGPLLDPSALRDEAPAPPAPAPSPAAPTPIHGTPRRTGAMPTPFGQPRGGASTPTPRTPRQQWVLRGAYALAALLCAAAGWAWFAASSAAPAPAVQPTAAPSAATVAPPAATTVLGRAVVAYDAPDGAPVGALDAGRPYTVAEELGSWRQLDVAGSGLVWVRAWEMDGIAPPTPTPLPTAIPVPTAAPAPVRVVPVGPAVTCVPVLDGDNGNAYLGEACGATSEQRQARALELLQAAPQP